MKTFDGPSSRSAIKHNLELFLVVPGMVGPLSARQAKKYEIYILKNYVYQKATIELRWAICLMNFQVLIKSH